MHRQLSLVTYEFSPSAEYVVVVIQQSEFGPARQTLPVALRADRERAQPGRRVQPDFRTGARQQLGQVARHKGISGTDRVVDPRRQRGLAVRPAVDEREGSLRAQLDDRAGRAQPTDPLGEFLGFVAVNIGITLLALAVPTALPVFLVKILGLPTWSPPAALALNAILVTVSAPIVMSAISGRRRRNVLIASQACIIVALAVLLLVHLLPAGAAVALVLIAVLPLAACEVMQGAVVPAVVTESATPLTVGRYTSAYQVTFSIADIICPAIVTVALHVGAAALWLPLAAVALLDMAAVGLLARRMTALTQRVGQAPPQSASLTERLLEAEGI